MPRFNNLNTDEDFDEETTDASVIDGFPDIPQEDEKEESEEDITVEVSFEDYHSD